MIDKKLLVNALKIGVASYALMFLLLGFLPLSPLTAGLLSYFVVASYATIRGLA
jgi:hypothetical protein